MNDEDEFNVIGKMTHIPKKQNDRGHGWFYRRPGIGRLSEDSLRSTWQSYNPDWPNFSAYHQFDKAHLVMLIEEGIIPKNEGIRCLITLRQMEVEGIDDARRKIGGGAHSGEAYLIQKLGWWTGGWIHAGRSSHDLSRTHQRIVLRCYILDVMDSLNELRETLLDLSEEHVDTIMPYWSHGQRGRPITLAFYFMTWVKMFERDFERLELCYKHTNISPAGTSEGTGTDFPLNPQRTSDLLGFDDVYGNANDMWLANDFITETFSALVILGDPLKRMGEDLQLWNSWEFRIAELSDKWCGTSSVMAHKKNPGAIYTLPVGQASAKGRFFLGTFTELQKAVRDMIDSIRMAIDMLKTTTWYVDRMKEYCETGWICIPDLARTMCKEKGLPWRVAHQICATLVRLAIDEGKSEQDVTSEFVDRAAIEYPDFSRPLRMKEDSIRNAFDPKTSVKNRMSYGGANPERVSEQIDVSRMTLRQDRNNVKTKRDVLKEASDNLEKSIDLLIGD